ncbi:MAG: hypothetical protein AAF639_13790 [Chloroflexota bacterium]
MKSKRSSQKMGSLRSTIVMGSIVATLLGTNLLARVEAQHSLEMDAQVMNPPIIQQAPQMLTVSMPMQQTQFATSMNPVVGNMQMQTFLAQQLQPIPQVNIPPPVTRSRSSR